MVFMQMSLFFPSNGEESPQGTISYYGLTHGTKLYALKLTNERVRERERERMVHGGVG